MVKQYDGILGVFEYDDNEYIIDENDGYLRCINFPILGLGSTPIQPIGCINFNYLFYNENTSVINLSSWRFTDDIIIDHMFEGLAQDVSVIVNESFFNKDDDKLEEQFKYLSNIKLFLINNIKSKIIEIPKNSNRDMVDSCIKMVESSPTPEIRHLDQSITILPDNDFSGDTINIFRNPCIDSYYGAMAARDTSSIKGSGSGYKRPRKNQKHYC